MCIFKHDMHPFLHFLLFWGLSDVILQSIYYVVFISRKSWLWFVMMFALYQRNAIFFLTICFNKYFPPRERAFSKVLTNYYVFKTRFLQSVLIARPFCAFPFVRYRIEICNCKISNFTLKNFSLSFFHHMFCFVSS